MKPLTRLFALAYLLLPTAVFAQSVPVNRAEILGRLVYRSSPSSLAHLIKQRGIDFTPSDSFLTQIKRAGGEGILTERLFSGDYRMDEPSGKEGEAPVEHMAKCSELIHVGAIEPAEAECRAAIKENPESPWPLLLTASLVERNAVETVPANLSDTSEEDAVAKEAEDLRNRAAALDPQGITYNGLEWVYVEPGKFLSRTGAASLHQI